MYATYSTLVAHVGYLSGYLSYIMSDSGKGDVWYLLLNDYAEDAEDK